MYNIQSHFTYLCLLYFALTYFVCLLFRRNKQKYHDTFLVCILSQELLVIQSSHGIHTSIKQIKAPFNPERNAQYTSVFTFMYWTHYSHPMSTVLNIAVPSVKLCWHCSVLWTKCWLLWSFTETAARTKKKWTPTQQVYHTAIEQHHSGRGD